MGGRGGRGSEEGGHLPRARDAREAVPGLRVPHTHVARQAAAHQQHAVAGQTLDVLREGRGQLWAPPPARPRPRPPHSP